MVVAMTTILPMITVSVAANVTVDGERFYNRSENVNCNNIIPVAMGNE